MRGRTCGTWRRCWLLAGCGSSFLPGRLSNPRFSPWATQNLRRQSSIMSTKSHNSAHGAGGLPENDTVAFDSRDVKARTIYIYLAVLAFAVILSYVVCVFVLRVTTRLAAESDTPPPPVRQEMKDYLTMPPEPRLQGVPGHGTDPQYDLREKMREDIEANEKAGWIDQNSGVAQIPVEDAMKIIAEKGWPAASTPPAERKKK